MAMALKYKNRREKNVELYLIRERWVVVEEANVVDVATPQSLLLLLFNCWLLNSVSYKLQDKAKLSAQIRAQGSVIEGLRSERKLWSEELAQQGIKTST